MVDGGQSPDLILDLTRGGVNSEVVKSLSLTLGIPTVAATYGSVGDIRSVVSRFQNIILLKEIW